MRDIAAPAKQAFLPVHPAEAPTVAAVYDRRDEMCQIVRGHRPPLQNRTGRGQRGPVFRFASKDLASHPR